MTGVSKKIIAYAIIFSSLAWSGCATTGDVERVEQKVSSANSELMGIRSNLEGMSESTRRDSARTAEGLDRMSAEVAGLKEEMALVKRNQANLGNALNTMAGGELMGVTGQMDELRHEVEATKLKLDAFKAALLQKLADIEGMLAEMSAAGGQAGGAGAAEAASGGQSGETAGEPAQEQAAGEVAAAASGAPPVADPLEMYQAAYLDYTKGNYELALTGFKDYLASFPDGEFAGNAQYWIGESLYSLGHYNEALVEFEKVLGNYPQSPKAPGAVLKKGFCFEGLGRKDDAEAMYRKVMEAYPASDAARIASDRLNPKPRGQVPGR